MKSEYIRGRRLLGAVPLRNDRIVEEMVNLKTLLCAVVAKPERERTLEWGTISGRVVMGIRVTNGNIMYVRCDISIVES